MPCTDGRAREPPVRAGRLCHGAGGTAGCTTVRGANGAAAGLRELVAVAAGAAHGRDGYEDRNERSPLWPGNSTVSIRGRRYWRRPPFIGSGAVDNPEANHICRRASDLTRSSLGDSFVSIAPRSADGVALGCVALVPFCKATMRRDVNEGHFEEGRHRR